LKNIIRLELIEDRIFGVVRALGSNDFTAKDIALPWMPTLRTQTKSI